MMRIVFESKDEIIRWSELLGKTCPSKVCITTEGWLDRQKISEASCAPPFTQDDAEERPFPGDRKTVCGYDVSLLEALFSKIRDGKLTLQDAQDIANLDAAELNFLYQVWEMLEGSKRETP